MLRVLWEKKEREDLLVVPVVVLDWVKVGHLLRVVPKAVVAPLVDPVVLLVVPVDPVVLLVLEALLVPVALLAVLRWRGRHRAVSFLDIKKVALLLVLDAFLLVLAH